MAPSSSERTPLIRGGINSDTVGSWRANNPQDQGHVHDGLLHVDEEPLNALLFRYGSPAGSLGLSGGIGVFGSSLARRASHATFEQHGEDTMRRRPSRQTIHAAYEASRDPSRVKSLKNHPSSRISPTAEVRADPVEEELGMDKAVPKFLGGVSEAQFWACFTGIVLVYFVACFDSTLMASSHPVITSYFDASNSASWLSTSFLLTSTAFQPMFGRISDTFGRKIPFLFSLVAFLLGTLWCALAGSIVQFILARAVCGLGAGGALAMGAIIMSDLVPLEARGAYLAFLNLSYGVGCSLGAALGGFLAETLGWRWEFGIQVPAVFICVMVAYFTTPSELGPMLCKEASQTFVHTLLSFDLAGSALLTSSVTSLILALNLGGNIFPWSHPLIIVCFVLFFVLGSALIYVEGRAEKPVMPLHMLYNIPRGNLIFSNFLTCMTMNTILFNVPLYFQAVMLDTPTRSGTRLIAPFLLNMIAAFATGNFISYSLSVRPTLVLGGVLIVCGSIALTIMPTTLPSLTYSWLISLATGGQGFNFPTISIAILAVSHPDDMAVATSTLLLFRSLGTVMGVAVSSLVAQNGLSYFLEQTVTGPGKEEIIAEVRRSVEAVVGLEGTVQDQVISAYASSMKLTFAQGILTATLGFLLIAFVKLPKLSNKPKEVAME